MGGKGAFNFRAFLNRNFSHITLEHRFLISLSGFSLGSIAGDYLNKLYQNEKLMETKEFYDLIENEDITIIREDEQTKPLHLL